MKYTIGNSIFGLMHYPTQENEWGLGQKFSALVERGYNHLEGDFTGYDLKQVRRLSQEHEFDVGFIRFGIRTESEMEGLLQEALTVGARYVVAIAGHSCDSASESVERIGTYMEMAAKEGLPFYLETHRDSATQDLRRLGKIIGQLPDLMLAVDLSHLLVAGEITDDLYDSYEQWLDPILERAKVFHGRISNGNQIQVSLNSLQDPLARRYVQFWKRGIEDWRRSGTTDRPFRFTVELGPPPYALTVASHKGVRVELHDRMEQGDMLIELFKEAWSLSAE